MTNIIRSLKCSIYTKSFYTEDLIAILTSLFLPFILLFFLPKSILALDFYINGGIGTVQIESKNGHILNCSRFERNHIGVGIDLEKEDYPLSISFDGLFFKTDSQTERWHYDGQAELMQEDLLDMHGVAMNVLAYYAPYKYAPKSGLFSLKPFLGGGFIYRRFKLDRHQITGSMIPISTFDDESFFWGRQKILGIGAMPHIGFSIDVPKASLNIRLNLGWAFFAANSHIDYELSFLGKEQVTYPMRADTSGNSMLGRIKISKQWDSFSVALGYEWEKILIDDKSIFFTNSGSNDIYLPVPEFEIIESTGHISLSYFF